MQDKILDFLKKKSSGYISGEEISQHLGISRQGLWKHILELKALGYEIIAVPHLGYRLVSIPDRLFPSEISYNLNTKFIGKKIYYFEEVATTMDIALDLGIKQEKEGTIILAEGQTKGKGRLGRSWFSPKYKGIYFSLILRPEVLPQQASLFTLLSGVSVCEAIKLITHIDVQIKWPNDILIHNKKLGGILTELSAEMDKVHFIVIGIGINVNNDKKTLPMNATSLKLKLKENINRIELLKEILRRIEENYFLFKEKQAKIIIEKWKEFNCTLTKRVKIIAHKEHIEGQAQDIDLDGSLLIRCDSGLIRKITAGDVIHCR